MNPLILGPLFEIGKNLIEKLLPDPEAKAKANERLIELQQSGELARMMNDTKLEEAFLADKQSARDRDTEYVKAGRNNYRGDVLAFAAIGALIACILLLFVFKVPAESRDLLLVTLGALVAIVKDVFSFEFGSSKGAERNSQAVSDMLKNGG
jgi:hypothetical protein